MKGITKEQIEDPQRSVNYLGQIYTIVEMRYSFKTKGLHQTSKKQIRSNSEIAAPSYSKGM